MSSDAPTCVAKSTRVLIVEDHAPTRLAMTKLIRQTGADVASARDGQEALGLILRQRFDVLLTDLRMPVMDGFELLSQCHKLPPSQRPARIIAISGEYSAHALDGQAVQFLRKPLDLPALLEMIGGKPN